MPKPEFPEEAKASGISGKVKIQVSIDEQGNVTNAKLIEGNKIFEENTVRAAMRAKFKPSKYFVDGQSVNSFGVIVFDFILDSISTQSTSQITPICNGFATYLPKPEVPQSVINANGKNIFGVVNVRIIIDEQGNVEKAQAVSGHPLVRPLAEKAAFQAKFRTTTYSRKPVKVNCVLVYNFASYDPRKSEENIKQELGSIINLGILNEKALILPMPQLSVAQPRGEGKIEVKVKINLQTGEVVSAMAVSGHPLIRGAAVKAALQAKFPTTLTEFSNVFGQGFLIYKFEDFNGKTIENKTPKKFVIIEKGVVNDRAKNLPKPYFSPDVKATGIVEVKIVVDMNGKVILAKAVSGHPILRASAETAARKTVFAPTIITTEPIYVKASLLYKFNSDHTVETNLTDKDLSSLNQKQSQIIINHRKFDNQAILLVKPEYPEAAIYVKASGSVGVEIIIDENGNVESAEAVSGHPLLRPASIKAALNSKFQPTYLSGKPVKVRSYIVYNFTS